MDKIEVIIIILMAFCLISVGWVSNEIYSIFDTKSKIHGLWIGRANWDEAMDYASKIEGVGNWVCVNVRKDMDFDECVRVASHECGHEIFAEKCEDDPKLCFRLMESLK